MQIDLYDFASLQTTTLIDTKDHTILPRIDSYTFDGDEKMILMPVIQIKFSVILLPRTIIYTILLQRN
jgi:hypothetical protein